MTATATSNHCSVCPGNGKIEHESLWLAEKNKVKCFFPLLFSVFSQNCFRQLKLDMCMPSFLYLLSLKRTCTFLLKMDYVKLHNLNLQSCWHGNSAGPLHTQKVQQPLTRNGKTDVKKQAKSMTSLWFQEPLSQPYCVGHLTLTYNNPH